jgi:hypothetical protein
MSSADGVSKALEAVEVAVAVVEGALSPPVQPNTNGAKTIKMQNRFKGGLAGVSVGRA